MSLKLNQEELQAILAEVESDLTGILKSEQKLSKAFGEESSEGSKEASEGSAPEGSKEAAPALPAEGSSSAEGSEGSSAEGSSSEAPPMAPDSAPVDGAVPPPAAAPEQDLEAKISALPDEQLNHLYAAVKAAKFARMQQAAPAPAAPAPEAAAPVAPPAPAAPAPDMAMKGEMKYNPANGEVAKKSEVDELRQQNELLIKAVSILGAPIRKAVTGISHVAKPGSEPMQKTFSKSEIAAKLNDKTRDPSLSKADREVINGYCNGRVSVDAIAHLLK